MHLLVQIRQLYNGQYSCLESSKSHITNFVVEKMWVLPVRVAARPKAWVWGLSPAEMWVRIPPEAWISVCCEGCVLSGRGLCDELITRP